MPQDMKKAAECFVEGYSGIFGRFELGESSDECCARAIRKEGDNESVVAFEEPEDPNGSFAKRKKYIEGKRLRLRPMGKLEEFVVPGDWDESYGGILNFDLMGKVGGFFFVACRKGTVVVFIQAYSTETGRQILEADRNELIVCAFSSLNQ